MREIDTERERMYVSEREHVNRRNLTESVAIEWELNRLAAIVEII